jgi:YD repeat-containing protein
MKSLFSFLLCVIILSNSGFSQVTGGRMNGESTPTEVKASSVTAGGVAGEVNLLNGSLNASYTLGTVSTPSGISYTATMSYSSVVSTGDTPPNVSGVPYGEGWKVNLPTISISTDVYNKYLQWEEQQMQTNISNDDKPYTRLFDNQTAQEEGDVYWYAPRLNIPGIAGGRMVYKYHQQNWHIFVLQKFDRYIEARFDGRTWEVFLDDGTIYEFAVRNISHTNASNQRLQPNVDDTNSLGNVVLPKSQILTWYCSRIKHRNKALNIRFHYDTYGCFNYYKELRQDGINSAINELGANGSGTRPPLLSACSEVFLREITAGAEKLVFEYGTEFFPNVGVSNLLDFRAADVSRKDSLYSVKTVYSRGGSGEPTFDDNWRRYYHIMRDDPQAANTQFTPPFNDPYKHTNASDGSRNYLFENIPDGSSEAVFNHGFLESERIQMSNTIPPGDIYEIVTKIEKDDVGIMGSLFDINIATGDNQTPQECPQCCQPSASSECSDEFDQNRGQSVFSTFNQAIKWGTSCIQHNEVELTTSNFFSLRNFPEQFEGFHIQVGPANSDMDFSRFREEDLDGGNCSPPNVCNAYFNKLLLGNYDPLNEELLDPGTRSGDAIQHKFGIGLPWHMMLPFYEEMDGDYALCSSSSFPWLEWWDNKAGSTCNMPTFAEDDHALKELKLKRYGKNTYLLRSVKKVVKNDQIDLQGNQPGPWYAVSNLKFTYELTPGIPVYTTATSPDLPGYLPKTFGLGVDRNIITLKKIIQLPLDGDETNIATAPTSHFEYSKLFNYTGFDVNEIEGGIITDFLILREITNPLGGKTEYTYYPFDSNSVFTISTFVSTLFSKPKLYFQPDNFYGMMINIPVQSKKIQDAQSVKYYHYHFGAKIGHWDIPGLNPHFRYMEASKSENAFGFKNATVFGPTTEADPSAEEGPEVKYYNHTTPELWGKVYKIEQKDEAGNWVSEREITYEAVLAFEPAFLRFVRVGSEYDYYDYFHDAAGGGQGLRPKIEDYTDLAAYFVGLRDWVLEDVNSSIEYVVWLTKQPVAPTFQCTDESGNTYTCGCAEFESLGVSEKEACTSYWANYSAWVSSKPDPSIEGLMHKEDADLLPSSGMYEAPKFYESRFGYDIYEKNPNYLNSYFIKKTQEVVKEYKGACDRSQYVETITDYDYFDADYRGMTSSSGYEELTGQTVPFQLHWEPSWQLYRTKTYSPDMGGETAAYTSSETYYLWDLVNDSYYQSGTTNYYPDVDFDLLWRTWAVKKTRNLPFEIRKIVKSPSDNEVTQTTYITYSKNWQTETEAAEIIEIDPSGIWPCDELEGDPAETGGDLPLPPCVVVKGDGVPPPNYCNPPEVNEPYIYCECDLPTIPGDVSYNLNPPDVNSLVGDPDYDFYNPYEDATDSEYVMFTIEGKIMPEKFIQRVGGSGEGVLRFDKNNAFLPNFEDIETLTTRQILSRNEYGQVVSEQNERGLVTKVTYNPIRVLIMPTCSYGEQVMVYEILENHVGLPKKVNVGEGLPDSLVTKYEYQMDNSIAKITDPNEIELTYEYDEYGRMIEGLRNGELIKSVSYNNWDNVTADFVGKANQNFVKETLHLNGADSYGVKSFVDPLGRSVGKVKSSGAVSVNIEDNIFDIHGRTILQLPPSSSSGVTVVSGFPNPNYAEYQYDIAPRGNPVKSSKFGLDVTTNQSVSTDQCLIGSGVLSAALNDAGQLAVPDGGKFLEVKVEDEDDKIVKEYLNAFGQKAAIIVEDAVNGNSATVFKYSSHGGISQISNPENHITGYKFNYLGQVYEKKTADAGYEYFSYDHSGNMIGHKDANGVIRIFSFDIFGRSTRQAKAATEENLFTNNGMPWIADPGLNDLHLLFSSGQTKYEKRWFYNSYNLGNTNDISGGALPYLDYSLSGARGKLVQSTSYSQHGKPIEFHFYSYNSDGFLKWEISQFNYNGIRFSQKGMAHRIDYRSYNRQGSVMLQEVDLGCNQSLDFQYEYDYDSWNRIEKVSVSFDGIDKHKVVEYQYDDEKGVVSQKKYYAGAENCNNYKIDQLDYEYDDPRFRMTKMTSRTFDWELFYDDEHIPDNPVGELETTNYNGNINASKANYKYLEFENPPPESFAGQKTYYNYEYDSHNRLSEADAYIEQLAMQTNDFQLYENYGNASYLYDKAGNFTTLTRHDLHGPSSIVPYEHTYQYEPNTNKVTEVYRFDYDLGISTAGPHLYLRQ